MTTSELYEKYENLSENEVNALMADIGKMRGIKYTVSTHHAFRVILENGWIPEVGILFDSGTKEHHKIRVSVNSWEQYVEIDENELITIERIAMALCRCFLIAYNAPY